MHPPQEQEQPQEEEDLDEDLLYLRLIALRSLATEKEEEEKREKEAEGKAEMLELLEEAKSGNPTGGPLHEPPCPVKRWPSLPSRSIFMNFT